MQFKVDENLPPELADLLAAAGHNASTVESERLSGAADPEIAAVCRQEGRILITLDLDFADQSFGSAVITVSVQYLTRPLAIFEQVNRILKPGGVCIVCKGIDRV